jgi:hypothetical protein
MKSTASKYSYNIDTVKDGDLIAVFCDHENCKRWIKMKVNYNSTMQCTQVSTGQSFDMRNQIYLCNFHRNKK